MPFGLSIPQVRSCESGFLRPFIGWFVVVYFDILVFSVTLEDHIINLRQGLEVLRYTFL